MTKPWADSAGSGCHTHISLLHADSGENAFGDADDPQGMTDACRSFIAGQLRYARDDRRRDRPDRELPASPAAAHVQPVEHLVGAGGPVRARPREGRQPGEQARRVPGALGALQPVPRRRGAPASRPPRDRGRAAGSRAVEAGGPGRGGRLLREAPARRWRSRSTRSSRTRPSKEFFGEDFVTAYSAMRRYELSRYQRLRVGLGADRVPGAVLSPMAAAAVGPRPAASGDTPPRETARRLAASGVEAVALAIVINSGVTLVKTIPLRRFEEAVQVRDRPVPGLHGLPGRRPDHVLAAHRRPDGRHAADAGPGPDGRARREPRMGARARGPARSGGRALPGLPAHVRPADARAPRRPRARAPRRLRDRVLPRPSRRRRAQTRRTRRRPTPGPPTARSRSRTSSRSRRR